MTPHDRSEAPCDLTSKQGGSGGRIDMTVAPGPERLPRGGCIGEGQSERAKPASRQSDHAAASSAQRLGVVTSPAGPLAKVQGCRIPHAACAGRPGKSLRGWAAGPTLAF